MAKITVTKHGLIPDGKTCNTAALTALIAGTPDGSTLVFPAGTYYFSRRVDMTGKKNLTLEGHDATLMTHFAPCGTREENNNLFEVIGCDDLCVRDFIITTDNPIGCAGRVVAIDREARTYDVKVYDEFPITGEEHLWGNNSCDEDGTPDYQLAIYEPIREETVKLPDGTERKKLIGTDYTVLPDNTIRVHIKDWEHLEGVHIGHLINFRYYIYGNTHFSFINCNRVELKNIDVYRATSMAIIINPRCSDFTLDHFNIKVHPGSRELYAANADGIHILGLCGYLRMKHCEFIGLGDDALNIHGAAGEITAVLPDGRLELKHRHRSGFSALQGNWAQEGDVIEAYDSASFVKKGTFTVGEFKDGVATVTASTGTYAVGDALANTAYFAATHISDCVVKNTRARGFLLQTRNVIVEDCYIFGMSLPAIIVSPDIKVWFEVGPSDNVVIRNNVFEKCAVIRSAANLGSIVVKGCHDAGADAYPAGVHHNMHIQNNVFRRIGNSGIYVSATDGVEISGNRFENCCQKRYNARAYGVRHDIVTRNCDHVTVTGNETTQKPKNLYYQKNCKNVKYGE